MLHFEGSLHDTETRSHKLAVYLVMIQHHGDGCFVKRVVFHYQHAQPFQGIALPGGFCRLRRVFHRHRGLPYCQIALTYFFHQKYTSSHLSPVKWKTVSRPFSQYSSPFWVTSDSKPIGGKTPQPNPLRTLSTVRHTSPPPRVGWKRMG